MIDAGARELREETQHVAANEAGGIGHRAANYVFYANGNAAATALLDPALIEDPGIYPPDAVREKLYVTSPYPADVQRFVTRLWTRIKGAQ